MFYNTIVLKQKNSSNTLQTLKLKNVCNHAFKELTSSSVSTTMRPAASTSAATYARSKTVQFEAPGTSRIESDNCDVAGTSHNGFGLKSTKGRKSYQEHKQTKK